ncbi:unnamed protein product [Clavelina lepadiformis]|uniref:Uncharacterized protein n=1 Tax=Clavelina lepadiformis TaxID=159417 RepID=A0ABP0GW16_CLALP
MDKSTLLSGVRVLDLTRILAGPYATMILGDMGAEVIKIENPNGGDDTRTWGPPYMGTESTYFLSINRNKKSVALNMKHKEGARIIRTLVRKSDILMENFVPGKLDSMGFGYGEMQKLNKGLIYCSLSGYGSDGPYAGRAGYDVIASSIGGLNHITGPENGDPCRVGVALTDISTGLYAHGAVLGALLQREKTGFGQKIECNLLSTQVALLSHIASAYLNVGVDAKRWGTGHANIVPYQAFLTKDNQYLTIGAGNNKHFVSLCKLMELEWLLKEAQFATNESRVMNRKELIAILKKKFLEKSISEWLEVLEGSGFPYGPINNIEQAFNDEQVQHNRMVMEMDHPGIGSKIKVAGPPVRYSEHSSHPTISNSSHPPLLGEHSREVLCELTDLSSSDIDELVKAGVVLDGA